MRDAVRGGVTVALWTLVGAAKFIALWLAIEARWLPAAGAVGLTLALVAVALAWRRMREE